MAKKINFKVYILVGFVFFVSLFYWHKTNAATEFLTSWKSPNSYVPNWYVGKALPTKDSKIIVSFEILEDGKLVNLKKTAIRWYLNDKLIANEKDGFGVQTISFMVPNDIDGDIVVRISLPNYKNKGIENSFIIPVKSPQISIEALSYNNDIAKKETTFTAWPFFFDVKFTNELISRWFVDGREAKNSAASNMKLRVDFSKPDFNNAQTQVEVQITNQKNPMSFGQKKIDVSIK